MEKIIHIDSVYRDVGQFPNPADFSFRLTGTRTVDRGNNVKGGPYSSAAQMQNASIRKITLVTPFFDSYDAILADEPFLYLAIDDFHHNDSGIFTVDGRHDDMKFVLHFDKLQTAAVPTRIIWKSDHGNVLRVNFSNNLRIRLCRSNGNTVELSNDEVDDVNLAKQLYITFEAIPFVHDGKFDNQFVPWDTPGHAIQPVTGPVNDLGTSRLCF